MKVGVWVNEPREKMAGGVYTYMDTLIAAIDNFDFHPDLQVVFLSAFKQPGLKKSFINITEHQRGMPFLIKAGRKMLKVASRKLFGRLINFIDQREKKMKDRSATAYLKDQGIGIIFYPMQADRIIEGTPYILNNWDLAHYSTYAFPEITGDGGFHLRDDFYSNILPGALMVFTETQTGKNEIARYLKFNPDKIRVFPIFTSEALISRQVPADAQTKILTSLGIAPQQFFFYPAQFWAHKNHYHLVNAFKKFTAQHPGFKLVLCGSDKGNIAYIKGIVKALSLEKNVIFTGFIEDDAIYTLYKNARALIMPTFLGPSNIPPIEAMHLGCPVLCSDIEGHREIMQNGALYFNPLDDVSIFESMTLIMDDKTRQQMITDQKELSEVTPHTIDRALLKLQEHFLEAINIRSCWE